MNTFKKLALHVLLPVLIIAGALGAAIALVQSRPEPTRRPPRAEGALVQVMEAASSVHRLDVEARGTVMAARTVTVQPQVMGRIEWMNPQLEIGGLIKKGEPLLRLEKRDYEIALEEARTNVEQARAQLAIEEGQQVIAQREWQLFEGSAQTGGEDPSLALRRPQLKMAQSQLKAAEARVKRAELELSRTTVKAPFNAFVQQVSAEVGQLASTQTPVATLVGTDTFWVSASVPVDRLAYVDVPGVNADEGSRALVRQDVGGKVVEREGRVVRLLGDLDQVGRMARVLVEIDDPMGLGAEGKGELPLLVGSYVEVTVEGNQEQPLVKLPRKALHDGDRVYVATPQDTLEIRQVEVAWRLPDAVLLGQGVVPGDRIIVNRLAAPVDGMKIRAPAAASTAAEASADAGEGAHE